jgi:selenium-binding protein 1
VLNRLVMPFTGDEFHHFGWNACSSALSPLSGHAFLQRRYLIIPGIRSSRIYIVDTQPDPRAPKLVKTIEPEEMLRKTGYSRPHTVHCGPEGIYVSTLGGAGADGTQGPPGVFIMDCETFEILGRWEIDRGPQKLHYDFWWNLPRDYMVSSEWGLPPQFENGIVAEDLLANKYGHSVHFWSLRERKHLQTIDLGANHQMALEIRPAHDPTREYGFLGVVVDTTNLEGSIWTWYRENGKFQIRKTATIPPEPADADRLPAAAEGLRRGAAADQRHRPVARRPLPVRGVLGHRRAAPVRRDRPDEAGAGRQRAHRRHRRTHARIRTAALRRRTADDGNQPRRQAGVLHQLALQQLGHAVLSGRRAGRAGDVQCRRERRHRTGSEFYVDFGPDYAAHQIRLQGGDCSTDSFCYPSA